MYKVQFYLQIKWIHKAFYKSIRIYLKSYTFKSLSKVLIIQNEILFSQGSLDFNHIVQKDGHSENLHLDFRLC